LPSASKLERVALSNAQRFRGDIYPETAGYEAIGQAGREQNLDVGLLASERSADSRGWRVFQRHLL